VIAAVVLAAGESSRLGRPKQALPHRGRSLLRHTVECAVAAGCDPVLVVLGARAGELGAELDGTPARTVTNEDWREGIGSSVRAGVAAVERERPDARAVLLLVCDQPRLTPQVLRRLLERFRAAGPRIVACEYAGTVGVPALFERALFPELLELSGPTGAKPLLRTHAEEVVRLAWPDGDVDVDRPGDLDRLG
jgi:molybdenum cofactor cytidylyltransferase